MTKNDASVKIIDTMNGNILELRSKVESEKRQNLDSNTCNTSLSRQLQDEQDKCKDLTTKNEASARTIDTMSSNIQEMSSQVENDMHCSDVVNSLKISEIKCNADYDSLKQKNKELHEKETESKKQHMHKVDELISMHHVMSLYLGLNSEEKTYEVGRYSKLINSVKTSESIMNNERRRLREKNQSLQVTLDEVLGRETCLKNKLDNEHKKSRTLKKQYNFAKLALTPFTNKVHSLNSKLTILQQEIEELTEKHDTLRK